MCVLSSATVILFLFLFLKKRNYRTGAKVKNKFRPCVDKVFLQCHDDTKQILKNHMLESRSFQDLLKIENY